MVNLHFANLPDVPRRDPGMLLELAYHNFGRIWTYLSRAKERIEQQSLRLAWEGPIDQSEPAAEESHEPTQAFSGYCIRLQEVDPEQSEEIFEAFFDEDWLSDSPKVSRGNLQVLHRDPERGLLWLSRLPNGPHLYIHPNTWSLFRQIKAIDNLRESPHTAHRPLIRLAERREQARWPPFQPVWAPPRESARETEAWGAFHDSGGHDTPAPMDKSAVQWKILTEDSVLGVDEEREFVGKALATPDFAVLEGPPGSGKTITICELILQEIERGHRVLLCASTHVAVDNVLEKLLDLGWMRRDVIAVRIATRDFDVSERVQHLILKRRVEAERKDLIRRLSGIKRRTPAQEFFLRALQEEGESVLLRLILDSANLICGTTIGILKHPDIAAGLNRPASPDFDVLIVDEASKTPFQEFLVPALYAKRWILVGDVKQLSPYVEQEILEENVTGIVSESAARASVAAFQAAQIVRRNPRANVLYCEENSAVRAWTIAQADKLGVQAAVLESRDEEKTLAPLWARLFVTDPANLGVADYLLPSGVEILGQTSSTPLMDRREAYWKARQGRGEENGGRQTSINWAYEVSWRLVRQFELRRRESEAERYAKAIQDLLPKWPEADDAARTLRDLDTVRQIALPSVLELLQEGFERGQSPFPPATITHGFPPEALAARHTLLTYQHRMHPDISRFPRNNFYSDSPSQSEAAIEDGHEEDGSSVHGSQAGPALRVALNDPPDMRQLREWRYSHYRSRAVWIFVGSGAEPALNRNIPEAERVIAELEAFMDWTRTHPHERNGSRVPWDVAVLSFYRAQEMELRRRLRVLFRSSARQHFSSKDESVRVTVGTVDRFQGHEADLVLLSFVRNPRDRGRRGGVGFLDSPNRLNVGITRARYQLVLVGNREGFARQEMSELLQRLAREIPAEIPFESKGRRRDQTKEDA